MFISTLKYYFSSINKLITNLSPLDLIRWIFNRNKIITLHKYHFYIPRFLDLWTIKEVFLDRIYTRYETPKGNVVDIGGGIGDFSILSAKTCSHVYAYEPDKTRIEIFKKNIIQNSIDNVKIYQSEAVSLDLIATENSLEKIDFLKIDCEGAEYQIFNNSSDQTIKRILYLAMEVHIFNAEQTKQSQGLIQRLQSNFEIKIVANPVHQTIFYLFAKSKI